jgi:hypothetical protein
VRYDIYIYIYIYVIRRLKVKSAFIHLKTYLRKQVVGLSFGMNWLRIGYNADLPCLTRHETKYPIFFVRIQVVSVIRAYR